jgi:transposase
MNIRRTRSSQLAEREKNLALTARCVRFVYNYMLQLCADTWYRRQTRIGYQETSAALDVLKGMRQYAPLTEVDSAPLDQALVDLASDFDAFHAGRAPYPVFRTQHEAPTGDYAPPAMTFGSGLPTARPEYPTSTRCFDCGYFLPAPPVGPEWTCPACGVIQDTALNTARNAEAVQLALEANGEA